MQPIRRLEQAVLNETASSGRLFERVARVKTARVEFSTAVTIKGVAVLVTFSTKSNPVGGLKIKKLLVSPQPTCFYMTNFVRSILKAIH